MTSANPKMIDLSHLALLDSGDLLELPLFDEGQLDSFHDDLKKKSLPGLPAEGSCALDLDYTISGEMESEWLRHFNIQSLPELPDVEMSFALDTLLQGCNIPTQADEMPPAGKTSPFYEAVSYETIEDPSFSFEGQDSPLSLEEVESYLSDPTPSLDDSLSLQSIIPAQQALSPVCVHQPAASVVIVAPLTPSPDSVADPPTPSSSGHSELMGLLLTPGEPKLTRSRPTPYSRPGRKAKAVKEEVEEEEDSCYPMTKKDKKKIQNKNAAIRYRQKKKIEQEAQFQVLQELEEQHDLLSATANSKAHEVQYLKSLATDMYEKRGIPFDIEAFVQQKVAEMP